MNYQRRASLERLEVRRMLSGVQPYTATMLKDINTTPASSNPAEIIAVGNEAFFTAADGNYGIGLWKSDGTAAGTSLVAGGDGLDVSDPTNVGGTIFFFVTVNATGVTSLWKTDGTAGDSVMVAEITNTDPIGVFGIPAAPLLATNNAFYFTTAPADGPFNKLWVSDGTASGTKVIQNFADDIGAGSGVTSAEQVSGAVFFVNEVSINNYQLWSTNGTASGTSFVAPYIDVSNFCDFGGDLYFGASDAAGGYLWKDDGTTLSKVVTISGAEPTDLTDVDGSLFFFVGNQVWRSDGTASGTVAIAGATIPGAYDVYNLVAAGSTLFFAGAALSGSTLTVSLWSISANGTGLTKLFSALPVSFGSDGTSAVIGSDLFLVNGVGLWASDGTANGTRMIQSFTAQPQSLSSVAGKLFIAANDGVHGEQLWTSDGATAAMVTRLDQDGAGSAPSGGIDVNGSMYFTANSGAAGDDLWKTDGTAAGTSVVAPGAAQVNSPLFDVNGNILFRSATAELGLPGYSRPELASTSGPLGAAVDGSMFTQLGNTLFFDGTNGTTPGIWKTDGTVGGTVPVPWITGEPVSLNGKLYFLAATPDSSNTTESDWDLWSSDGTAIGTSMVVSLGALAEGDSLALQTVGNKLLITPSTAGLGTDAPEPVWISDGSATRTSLLATVPPGFYQPTVGQVAAGDVFVEANSQLYFTDGTSGGTTLVATLSGTLAGGLNPVNGVLVFAISTASGEQLWVTDGTQSGTKLLMGGLSKVGSSFVALNGKLYFSADDDAHGSQLWTTDGTASGTYAVTDINPDESSGGFDPSNITVVDGLLTFAANDGTHGVEPWESNGTSAGTAMIKDINPGPNGSFPQGFTAFGQQVFFSADDGTHGQEPWILTPAPKSLLATGGITLAATERVALTATTVATFTDPNGAGPLASYSAMIDWGDGTSGSAGTISGPDANGRFTVLGVHTYTSATNTPDTIAVAVARGGSPAVSVSDTVTVTPSGVMGAGASLTGTVGAAISAATVATFTDSGAPASDFTATIDWGDGQTSAGTVGESGGTYSVVGTHTYATPGTFAVNTTVSENGIPTVLSGGSNITGTATQRYVAAVFQDVLGRAVDPAGLQYWTQQIATGTAISNVAQAIVQSAEYYQKFVIEPDYLKLLGRPADAAGIQYWVAQMQAGLTDQELEAGFIATDEFYSKAGGTDQDWIDAAYQLLLGRPADSSGEGFWESELAAAVSRSQVALGIAGSTENNTQLINDDYMQYLGRTADPAGLAYWLAQFADGATNEDVIAGFTGSAEYYDEHTS